MKNLLSKEHYRFKIYTLLMKSSAYPTFCRQSPCMGYPLLWDPPSMIFQKFQPSLLPLTKGRGLHITYDPLKQS